ncbi:nickel-dependent lactate racemase [Orenia marismortui]|uniref:Nickel-dependent lactate racemase n=1 Tax=Orenia marismortui TaxID=46469 RepID=A0A4R8H126_9FIRM|nr:nickel-dependent lactate racemase [Orenia marismortui]TDX51665.1 nickel-dependent lactate racemase [Orenia marismortui]
MKLKYGAEKVNLNMERLGEQVEVLLPNEREGLVDPLETIEDCLEDPIASSSLEQLLAEKSPNNVVIVVNDVSRLTPYEYMLPPLLNVLHKAGINKEEITFIIATGIHDPNTEEQNRRIFGDDIVDNYRLISHDPDNDLVDMGKLDTGNSFYLNREVLEADFLITTGVITPHYFAGFSGGRKSILPGVAGRDTIQNNHAHMVNLVGNLPRIEDNPVSLEMIEAARKAEVDFILNVVTNSKKEIVEVVAGDLEAAWYQGVSVSAEMYHVPIKHKADIAIVSAGGYPKDINIYQAQKALDNADYAVKDGGIIVLLAECRAGLGEDVFEEWLNNSKKPEDNVERIREKFVIGGHKAFAISKVVLNKEFILISEFNQEFTELMFAKKMDSLDDVLSYIEDKYNDQYSTIIMPQGGLTVAIIE